MRDINRGVAPSVLHTRVGAGWHADEKRDAPVLAPERFRGLTAALVQFEIQLVVAEWPLLKSLEPPAGRSRSPPHRLEPW